MNPNESMTLRDHTMRGLLPTTASTVPTSSPSSDVSNGLCSVTIQREPSVEHGTQETDDKVFRMQSRPKEGHNLKDNLTMLNESIAHLNRISSSESSDIRAPDSFTFKMEEFSPADKADYDFQSYSMTGKDSDRNERQEDNTLDILQSLDLPGSLLELNDFCEMGDDFLPCLEVEDSLLRDTKPVSLGNDINVNAKTHPHQEQSNNLPVIKTEKDTDFIQLCTPGVIKQENERRGYCQMSGHPREAVTLNMDRPSYIYGISSSLPDQKPPVGLYGSLPTDRDGWIRGNSYGDSIGIRRASESMVQPCLSTYTYNR